MNRPFNYIKPDSSKLALIKKDISFSYSELNNISDSYAAYFQTSGVKQSDYVGILTEQNEKFIFSVLALWKLGAVPVPINNKFRSDEIGKIINQSDITFIITDDKYSEQLSLLNVKSIELSKEKLSTQRADFIHKDNEEAVVIFTSGSTDKPKGVVHTFDSLTNSILNAQSILKHESEDKWLASLPFYHIGGFQIICRTLYYGSTILLPDSFKAEDLRNAIKSFIPTHASFVSAQLSEILKFDLPIEIIPKISLIGGGFIDNLLLQNAINKGWNTIKVYGSSETGSFVCALSKEAFNLKTESAGLPLKNVSIKIIKSIGEECKPLEYGEIVVRTNSLFKKYINNSDLTELQLKDGFYFTGDYGYVDEQGYLFISGRKSEMISTGGEKVFPIEIESVLIKHDSISEAAVYALKDIKWGEIVAASVILKQNIEFDESKLVQFLSEHLSKYKIPKKIFVEEDFPRTELGKIEKIKLIEKHSN